MSCCNFPWMIFFLGCAAPIYIYFPSIPLFLTVSFSPFTLFYSLEWKWYKVLKAFTHNSQSHKRKYSWGIVYGRICYSKGKKLDDKRLLSGRARRSCRVDILCRRWETYTNGLATNPNQYWWLRKKWDIHCSHSHHPLLSSKPQSVCSST